MNQLNSDHKINELLNYPDSIEAATQIQDKWRTRYLESLSTKYIREQNDVRYIAGIDISYDVNQTPNRGYSCAVLWDCRSKHVIEITYSTGEVLFPYVSGFLAFRESKLSAEAIRKLKIKPDLIMCDSHGYCHPKRFGFASVIGFALEIPSIGIAKKPLSGLTDISILKPIKGEKIEIKEGIEVLGLACILSDNSKPVYISKGHGIELEIAFSISLENTLDHKQPEPLFLSHVYGNERKKKYP